MFQINNMTQMSCNFREQCKIVRMGGIPLWGEPNQTSPLTSHPAQVGRITRQIWNGDGQCHPLHFIFRQDLSNSYGKPVASFGVFI